MGLTFTADASDDFYFTLERVSLHSHHQIALDKDFDEIVANENTLAQEDDVFEGEIALSVSPMVHDITYANDWERGSIVKVNSPFFLWCQILFLGSLRVS